MAAFVFVRSPDYERWNQSHWGARLDYAFDTAHQDADVLIFGDSSAFIGVDPRIVGQRLGLKTLVLPATIGSLPITGQMVLDRYLASNTKPRLLVIFLPPWNLDYEHTTNLHPFEGEEMLFRHGTLAEIASFTLHHPHEAFLFPFRLFSTFDPAKLKSTRERPGNERDIADAMGHYSDTEPFASLTNSCKIPPVLVKLTGEATVHTLIAKYSPRYPVMVYLSPIPGCPNAADFPTRTYPDLGAAPAATLPPDMFLDDLGFAHVRPPFVAQTSQMFADAVAKRLGIPSQRPR